MMALGYCLIALLAWPLLSKLALKVLMEGSYSDEPDIEDLIAALIMGGCCAFIWPLMGPAAAVLHILRSSEVKA